MSDSDSNPPKIEPFKIHAAEQSCAAANEALDNILKALINDGPIVEQITGLSDESVAYDYILSFIATQHNSFGAYADRITAMVCAAALARLARASRDQIDMTHFEKNMMGDNGNGR